MNLDKLVNDISVIGENHQDIKWIMKEGICIQDHNKGYEKMPDLIIRLQEDYLLVELKKSRARIDKAYAQIESGINFLQTVEPYCFDICANIRSKIAIYGGRKGIQYQTVR